MRRCGTPTLNYRIDDSPIMMPLHSDSKLDGREGQQPNRLGSEQIALLASKFKSGCTNACVDNTIDHSPMKQSISVKRLIN